MQRVWQLRLNKILNISYHKCEICMQNFNSIDNKLAEVSRELAEPPSEREEVGKNIS